MYNKPFMHVQVYPCQIQLASMHMYCRLIYVTVELINESELQSCTRGGNECRHFLGKYQKRLLYYVEELTCILFNTSDLCRNPQGLIYKSYIVPQDLNSYSMNACNSETHRVPKKYIFQQCIQGGSKYPPL